MLVWFVYYVMNHINEIDDLDDLESQANQANRYDSRDIISASNMQNAVTSDRENEMREISKENMKIENSSNK